jgi:hypothetical protein
MPCRPRGPEVIVKPSRLGLADAALPRHELPDLARQSHRPAGERSSVLLPVLSRTRRTVFSEPEPT